MFSENLIACPNWYINRSWQTGQIRMINTANFTPNEQLLRTPRKVRFDQLWYIIKLHLFVCHQLPRSIIFDPCHEEIMGLGLPFLRCSPKIIAKTKWHHDECRSSLAYDETYFAGNYCAWDICSLLPEWRTGATTIHHMWAILLMEEILHQLIGSLSHYLQGFAHPRWCRISSINSSWFPFHSR